MGFWNDGIGSPDRSEHHHRSSESRHYSSRPANARSSSSFFGGSSTSRGHSRAQPRRGYVNRAYSKLRKFIRDILYYMKKNPIKVFMLVIMPLITGGALHKILKQFGVRMPPGLEEFIGGGRRGAGMNDRYYSRGGARDYRGGSSLPGMGGGMGESVQGLLNVAKMFM